MIGYLFAVFDEAFPPRFPLELRIMLDAYAFEYRGVLWP